MTSLAFLSLSRVGHTFWRRRKVPHVPTPTERMQAYNAARPIQFANTTFPSPSSRNPSKVGRASSSKDHA